MEGRDESVAVMEEEAHVSCAEALLFPAMAGSCQSELRQIFGGGGRTELSTAGPLAVTGPGVFESNTTRRQDARVKSITEGLREDMTWVFHPSCTLIPTP